MIFDLVDQIYCLIYNPYKEERYQGIVDELTRIGIIDKVKFMYFDKDESLTPVQSNFKNHCTIFKDALYNNYNRIMTMEDDIRFLKNINILNEFDHIPEDSDLIMLDYQPANPPNICSKIANTNGLYYKLNNNERLYFTSCNIYSQRMMIHLIMNFDINRQIPVDHFIFCDNRCYDPIFDRMLNRYACCTNLCIQKYFKEAVTPHASIYNNVYKEKNKLNLDDYNI